MTRQILASPNVLQEMNPTTLYRSRRFESHCHHASLGENTPLDQVINIDANMI
jgi:hypothetical protein